MKRKGFIRWIGFSILIPSLVLFYAKIAYAGHGHESHPAPGTYGDSTHVGQFTVDSNGVLTAAANVAITLANTGVTAGSYTNANITVGADGRISAASNGSSSGVSPNSLDFTEFKDAMTVDADTTIDTNGHDLTLGKPAIDNSSVTIGDEGLAVGGKMSIATSDLTFTSCSGSGIIPLAPTANGLATRTAGQIVLPGGTTSSVICSVFFTFFYTNRPICTVSPVTATGTAYHVSMLETGSLAPNQIAILVDAPMAAGDGFNYICMDH